MSHNFIIFSSYFHHIFVIITAIRDEILTAIFIFFSTWLYNNYSCLNTLQSQIKTRYMCINYRTIFKIFISSAVAFQKSRFVMRIQDIDLSSFFQSTIDREAIQSRTDTARTLSVVSQFC